MEREALGGAVCHERLCSIWLDLVACSGLPW